MDRDGEQLSATQTWGGHGQQPLGDAGVDPRGGAAGSGPLTLGARRSAVSPTVRRLAPGRAAGPAVVDCSGPSSETSRRADRPGAMPNGEVPLRPQSKAEERAGRLAPS